MELERDIKSKLIEYLQIFPCIALLGPRQSGKTTLVKMLQEGYKKESIYLDLESDEDQIKLRHAERYFNDRQDKLIIIDEIQRNPKLFILLRSVIDRKRDNGRFLLLGSASPELLISSSESLAGRIAYLEIHPFSFNEIRHRYNFDRLWLKGGFPQPFLEDDNLYSQQKRLQFIQTYVERELAILGLRASSLRLKLMLRMVAHQQGQLVNYTQISNSLGLDINTVKRYLDYFENAFLIRRIEPYHINIKKRLVKSPKIYIRDTGIFHTLSAVDSKEDLDGFIGKGSSWESFVIQQVIAQLKSEVEFYFYRTQDGTELDLVLVRGLEPILGLEIKLSNSPTLTRGTTIASQDLGDIPIIVVTHSVGEDYNYSDKITISSFERLFIHLDEMELLEFKLAIRN